MVTKIWYSITNSGDGSPFVTWCNSKELALIDQRYGYNIYWGETCVGGITIESDAFIINIKERIETPESMLEGIKKWNDIDDPSYPHDLVEALTELINKMKGKENV